MVGQCCSETAQRPLSTGTPKQLQAAWLLSQYADNRDRLEETDLLPPLPRPQSAAALRTPASLRSHARRQPCSLGAGEVHTPDGGVVTTLPLLSRRCAGMDTPRSPARVHLRHAQWSRARQHITPWRAAGAHTRGIKASSTQAATLSFFGALLLMADCGVSGGGGTSAGATGRVRHGAQAGAQGLSGP